MRLLQTLKKIVWIFLLCGPAVLTGCGPLPGVVRTLPGTTTDVSGHWNDSDSQKTADELISGCLSDPWGKNFRESHNGRIPVVIVDAISNLSFEHINVQAFTKAMEWALSNSKQVAIVASSTQRQEIRRERTDMAANASDRSFKGPGMETGADFMLTGEIDTIVDEAGGIQVIYYQVALELIDMMTNHKVWIGVTRIKKVIRRPYTQFSPLMLPGPPPFRLRFPY